MQITYQKNNGSIIKRFRNTMLPYKIGETTSMGWKVLNIEYEYKNEYYTEYKYNVLINKNKQLMLKRKQLKELLLKEFKMFFYSFLAVLLLNFIKIIIGM